MQLIITARDQVLARYGNQLTALGEGQARTAMSRALNHEGEKRRTQVKRSLVKQTGIKYGAVDKAMATIRATPATLTYTLKARAPPDALIISGREGDAQVPQLPLRLLVIRDRGAPRRSVSMSGSPNKLKRFRASRRQEIGRE
jgi:hypothetical protein